MTVKGDDMSYDRTPLDLTTDDGLDGLLENLTDVVEGFWGPLEPFRNPKVWQGRRSEIATSYTLFSRYFVEVKGSSPCVTPHAKTFGPLLLLLFQACELNREKFNMIFSALDEVRRLRDERRSTERTHKPERSATGVPA
jgi:hypothetical protein